MTQGVSRMWCDLAKVDGGVEEILISMGSHTRDEVCALGSPV